MNLPHQIQQDLEQWIKAHGMTTEEFILQAVTEKLYKLASNTANTPTIQPIASPSSCSRLHDKDGILVLKAATVGVTGASNGDINALIEQLREERIQEQMGL